MSSKYPPGVSRRDVIIWLREIPRLQDVSSRFAKTYVRQYDVIAKIDREKKAGRWPPTRVYIG